MHDFEKNTPDAASERLALINMTKESLADQYSPWDEGPGFDVQRLDGTWTFLKPRQRRLGE